MNPWAMHLSRHWFAIALSDRVGAKPSRVEFMDRPIALARFADGKVAAFEDRCPHRQAPLSAGCVVGRSIRCPYHGWRYDASGALVELPGLPEGEAAPGVRAGALQVREHDGIVWVRSLGDVEAPLPSIALAQPTSDRRFLWTTTWPTGVVDSIENVLDPTHTHYVHAGLVRGQDDRRPMLATIRDEGDGFVVDYEGQSAQSGLIYRLFESSRNLERARFAAPGSIQVEYGYSNGANARISIHFTPETRDRTRFFVAFHIRGRWAPAWAVRLLVWPFLRRVSQQDARMLALQSANRARFADRRDAIGPLDIVRGRLEAFWSPRGADGGAPETAIDRRWMML